MYGLNPFEFFEKVFKCILNIGFTTNFIFLLIEYSRSSPKFPLKLSVFKLEAFPMVCDILSDVTETSF